MPATISHALSMTTPDDPAYENQPQHWNSAHLLTLNAAGSEISGAFTNGGGVSFGLSANGALSATVATNYQSQGAYLTTAMISNAATISNIRISAGTTSNLASAFTFADGGGVSFGLDNGTITGTVATNYLTSQSNQAVSAANGSYAFQTLSFSNANGMSFGTSAGSAVTGSYTVPTVTNSSWTVSDAATSGSVARLAFTNLNGVTLSLSSGAGGSHTIVGSHNALTSQSNQAFSAGAASSTFQTMSFQDSNGVSFSNNAGAIRVTHDLQFTSATSAITSNAMHSSQSRMSAYAVSNTTQSTSFAIPFNAVSFHGAGIASVGVSNGSVVISVPAGAPSPVNFSAGTTSGDLGSVVFSNSNGVSFGLNGSTITGTVATNYAASDHSHGNPQLNLTNLSGTTASNSAGFTLSLSANAPGGGGTLSSYLEGMERLTLLVAPGNGSVSLARFKCDQNISGTQIALMFYQSISSSAVANTYGQRWTIQAAVYTNDTAGNRLMSLSSGSTQTTYTLASNTAGATQLIGSGVRPVTCPLNMNMTPGIYYLAFALSTNTFSSGTATTALNRTVSVIGRGAVMSASFALVSEYNVATAATANRLWPQGILSNGAISSVPLTISHSQITMTGASYSNANVAFYIRA